MNASPVTGERLVVSGTFIMLYTLSLPPTRASIFTTLCRSILAFCVGESPACSWLLGGIMPDAVGLYTCPEPNGSKPRSAFAVTVTSAVKLVLLWMVPMEKTSPRPSNIS